MGLKLADPSATKRFVRGDDEDWIKGNADLGMAAHPDDAGDDAWVECRTSLSKRDDMTINDASTSERILGEDGRISLKPAKQAGVDPPVFRLIVADWSLGDVAVEQYEKLDAGDAEWVDSCIRRAIDIARGTIQGNSNSPRTAAPQNDSPNSSDSEASPTPAT
jgi:hypothetical protein